MPPIPLTPRRGASGLGAQSSEAVTALLRDLRDELPGDWVRPGGGPAETDAPTRLATHIERVDALLSGGFPRGRLSEITGSPSSGRTSLATALLAATTRAGELCAWIDTADAFCATSARIAGVDLRRLLWVRAPQTRQALRCTERLLEAQGFGLVVLQSERPESARRAASPQATRSQPEQAERPESARRAASPQATRSQPSSRSPWLRLARSAAASGAALVVLGSERLAGSSAALSIDLRPGSPHFDASWMDGLDTALVLTRNRLGPPDGTVPLHLKVPSLACGLSAHPGPARGRGDTSPP